MPNPAVAVRSIIFVSQFPSSHSIGLTQSFHNINSIKSYPCSSTSSTIICSYYSPPPMASSLCLISSTLFFSFLNLIMLPYLVSINPLPQSLLILSWIWLAVGMRLFHLLAWQDQSLFTSFIISLSSVTHPHFLSKNLGPSKLPIVKLWVIQIIILCYILKNS